MERDSFAFSNVRERNMLYDHSDDWDQQDMRGPDGFGGVPDQNGDGRSDWQDLAILTLQMLLDKEGTNAESVVAIVRYDSETNTVQVTATDTSSGNSTSGAYDFDNNSWAAGGNGGGWGDFG